MNVLETAILWSWEDTPFIALLQVVTDMQKTSSLEGGPKLVCLSVTGNKACKPVICYTNARNDLSFAHVLKAGFTKDCELADGISGRKIRVWLWENLSIVQEH